jgi:ATP-dependent DNA helicase RecG
VKKKDRISNREYQVLNEVSDRTALRDIEELTQKGIFIKEGEKKGTSYILSIGG